MSEIDASTFLALLIVVAVVAAAVRVVRLPYEVALVLTGLAMAVTPGVPQIAVTHDVILTVFLPVLLFHAAYNLSLADLKANFAPIAILALPGVLVTAGLVGVALHVAAGLAWSSALLFGTIVSATDPISVLAIFRQVRAPRRLSTIVNGESLFNDGTALVLFAIVLGVASHGHFSLVESTEELVLVIAGSLILGAAVGLIGAQVLGRFNDALLETTITVIMAYGGYLLADHLRLSGPLETVVAGLALGTRGEFVMAPETRQQATATWEFLDFLVNSLVFLLMGLSVRPIGDAAGLHLGGRLWEPLLVALGAVLLSRLVVVTLTRWTLAALRMPLPAGWDIVLIWAGLRGAVSLAAALSLPPNLLDRDLLPLLTFAIVLFTLLGQGLSIKPLLAKLGIAEDAADAGELEIIRGRLTALEAAGTGIARLRRDGELSPQLSSLLAAHIERQRATARLHLTALTNRIDPEEQQTELAALRRIIRLQQDAVARAYLAGTLSEQTMHTLHAELEHTLAHPETALEALE